MGATRDLLERSIAAWNRHDRNAWVGDFASNAQLSGPGGLAGSGPQAVERFYSIWQNGFPDNQIRPVIFVEEGSTGVLEALFEGTHTAPLNAPGGSIPPHRQASQHPIHSHGPGRKRQVHQAEVVFRPGRHDDAARADAGAGWHLIARACRPETIACNVQSRRTPRGRSSAAFVAARGSASRCPTGEPSRWSFPSPQNAPADVPLFAPGVGSRDEGAFTAPHENAYLAHGGSLPADLR